MSKPTWPRERVLSIGAKTLTEPELWQCILGWGRPGHSVQELSRQVTTLTERSVPLLASQLSLPSYLGSAQQARILAVVELAHRWRVQGDIPLRSPESVLAWCHSLRQSRSERILVLYCGLRGEVLRSEIVAMGGLNAVAVTPKDIFRPILDLPVDSLVICHNHPSGSLEPSPDDEVFTVRMEAACRILGYTLRDHLIVTRESYFSFREAGRLQPLP